MAIQKFNNSTTISKEQIPFTQVNNNVIQNMKEMEAFCVWVYLLSMPPDWRIIKEQIKKHFGIGDAKIKKIFSCLNAHNLIRYEAIRNETGNDFSHWNIVVLNGNDFIKNTDKSNTNNRNRTGSKSHRVRNAPGAIQGTTNKIKNNKDNKNKKERGEKKQKPLSLSQSSLEELKSKIDPGILQELSTNKIKLDFVYSKFKSHMKSKSIKQFNISELELWIKRELDYSKNKQKSCAKEKNEIKSTVKFFEAPEKITASNRETARTNLKSIKEILNKGSRVVQGGGLKT